MRTFSDQALDDLEAALRRQAGATAESYGCRAEVEFRRASPPVVNHPHETRFAAEVMRKIVGEPNVPVQEPSMASEDFAYMLEAKAGCYAFIGNGHGDHRAIGHGEGPCMLHNASYDFNDELIPLGGSLWVRLVEKWFTTQP